VNVKDCWTCGAAYDAMSPAGHACPAADPAAPLIGEPVTAGGLAGRVRRIRVGQGPIPTWVTVYHPAVFRERDYRVEEIERCADRVVVLISNSYTCGRVSTRRVALVAPPRGVPVDAWLDGDEVHGLTGDGHSCGSSEHALYEVEVVEAPTRPDLVGATTSSEG